MERKLLPAVLIVLSLSSCTAFKSLNLSRKQTEQKPESSTVTTKFIDDISIIPPTISDNTTVKATKIGEINAVKGPNVEKTNAVTNEFKDAVERNPVLPDNTTATAPSPIQIKYAGLLNTDIASLPSLSLLEAVDDWYGVRYRTGGESKHGVDCSGFTVAVYAAAYGYSLPRVSRDQYNLSRKISTTELQEGDLVFFNIHGWGISHVGIYLGNNHFAHASVSKGVTVSNLFDDYYVQRFAGAGRIDNKQATASN